MRWLLFLSRLAFICGICFMISLGLAMTNWKNVDPFTSTIIIIGYAMGLVIVPATILTYFILALIGKKLRTHVPPWLIVSNIIFLFVLLFYLFYLNDPYYHQK